MLRCRLLSLLSASLVFHTVRRHLHSFATQSDREVAARVLAVPPEQRTEDEVKCLAFLLKNNRFFKGYSDKLCADITKVCQLIVANKHEVGAYRQ